MQKKTDRFVAVQILSEITENAAYANIALRKALAESELDSRARAFVTDMVNETLRNLIQIDSVINKFSSKTPVDKMKPAIRSILRVATCQILFMEKIPSRAAINEAVTLAKIYGFENLSGFVNGVLRNIDRGKPFNINNFLNTANPSQADILSLTYSYPKWLVANTIKWLGDNAAETFFKNSHTPPPVVILTNTYKTTLAQLVESLQSEEVEATPIENSQHPFLVLRKSGDITRLAAFKQGHFFVMDPGAMRAVSAVEPKPGQTIIDLCAAPGGKSFALACRMQNQGTILSYDIHPHRVELINQTRKRLGLTIVTPAVKDICVFDPALKAKADTVLLDAPCSSLGTIRKHPEMKYTRKPTDILELAEKQSEMLKVAAKYVKPGGKLVYCTCTITKEENPDNIQYFLKNHPQFSLEFATQTLPTPLSDGFYVAVLANADN